MFAQFVSSQIAKKQELLSQLDHIDMQLTSAKEIESDLEEVLKALDSVISRSNPAIVGEVKQAISEKCTELGIFQVNLFNTKEDNISEIQKVVEPVQTTTATTEEKTKQRRTRRTKAQKAEDDRLAALQNSVQVEEKPTEVDQVLEEIKLFLNDTTPTETEISESISEDLVTKALSEIDNTWESLPYNQHINEEVAEALTPYSDRISDGLAEALTQDNIENTTSDFVAELQNPETDILSELLPVNEVELDSQLQSLITDTREADLKYISEAEIETAKESILPLPAYADLPTEIPVRQVVTEVIKVDLPSEPVIVPEVTKAFSMSSFFNQPIQTSVATIATDDFIDGSQVEHTLTGSVGTVDKSSEIGTLPYQMEGIRTSLVPVMFKGGKAVIPVSELEILPIGTNVKHKSGVIGQTVAVEEMPSDIEKKQGCVIPIKFSDPAIPSWYNWNDPLHLEILSQDEVTETLSAEKLKLKELALGTEDPF